MAKVYVSSTIADLTEERRAVLDWLRLARHQAVDSYLPDSDTVRDSCLDDVAACDLYVLIVGHRYGFQPPEGNPEGLSITQLEFRRAGQCGIPRVALLRTSSPDVRVSDLLDPARAPLVLGFRDEVAREVRPAEFSDLQGLIQGLSTGIQAELDKRDTRSARAVAAGRALRLAPRPVFLAGREELLAELEARLSGDADAGPRVVALCGLGGAGKTSVAAEYAHRQLGGVGVAWQFGAEDRAVLAAGFGELAAQLGVADRGDPVASVHGMLAASPAPWLLVFDNAPDRASVARFVPPAGPGRVLITSRNQLWPPGQALEVPVLDPQVAAGFLVGRTGDADRRAALELAGELGGLPLALEQAAAYVQAGGDSLAGYLASFLQRRADLLARGEPTGYSQTVATTWRLAFEDLEHKAPGAVGLLRLLAFCGPEAVPLRLLLQPRPELAGQLGEQVTPVLAPLMEDPLAASDAIGALRRYSLVTPAAGGSVSVHRLVQAVTADQMPADLARQWRQATAALIEAALPAEPLDPGTWPVYAMLLPHVQAAAPADSAAAAAIADYLGYSGSYPVAREIMGRVLEARERTYGPEHPETLIVRRGLAHWTAQAGETAAARDQLAGLLPVAERVLGPEHPDTLTTRERLARWTGEAGNPAAARDLYAALVPVCERVLGPEQRTTLTVRQGLAAFTGRAGDVVAARDQSAALVPVYERVLGLEHTGTLGAKANLAGWTGRAGDPAAARDLAAEVLAVHERVFGPEHPTPRRPAPRRGLDRRGGRCGRGTRPAGRTAAQLRAGPRPGAPANPDHPRLARPGPGRRGTLPGPATRSAALLSMHGRVLDPEHPDTLAARVNLAYWTARAGDPAGARDQDAARLTVHEPVLGPEHPDTLDLRANLARWTGEAGDAAGARSQSAVLVPICERVFGPEHPQTLSARTGLARWTGHAGDAAGARDQFAALLAIYERVLGPEHPETLAARTELARWTGKAGDAAGARDQYAALLPVRERVLGPEHPHTQATRDNLAYWTRQADAAHGPIRNTPQHHWPVRVAGPGCSVRWLGHAARATWGWELAKVYVSSTIIDLKPERQAVLDWLRLARHQAIDSDLPDSDTVRDSCLADVAACDLYVLILGHRYGVRCPDDNPEGLSITHLEFRRAASAASRGWCCCAPAVPIFDRQIC